MPSVTVWDDEAQRDVKVSRINRWGAELKAYAVKKGMPEQAEYYTRRHPNGTATIFEWTNG